MSSKLFQPLQIGQCALKNRVVMAPLTRFRANDTHAPLPIVAEYYAQRASVPGTLLVSEATFIAPQAGGYDNAPGIYSEEQIAAWKKVTDAIHAKGSFIYLQLWALGRAADPNALAKDGFKVKSSSDVAFEGGAKPEPLTEAEIQEYIGLYAQAAKNAVAAGFDGVEIHGANGYLIDQFTQDTSNKRTDAWGGSIEKRARFGLEVAKAVVEAVGADKTGIRLSPFSSFQGMKMADPVPQFTYLVNELKKLNLAYLHLVESRIDGNADTEATEKVDPLIEAWGKTSPVLLAGGFKPDSAKRAVDEEYKDKDIAIVFGRLFISNPDIVFRIQHGIELTPYDRNLFYNKGEAHGYTTWPFSKEFEAAHEVLTAA
ncbi:NADH:flavin oxidoreductase oxidase family protein-like protein [Coleophoma cylindrospora]|uniref:NADH:flavin oxidoreductase oxidase family protein-like protein n=1 Tax=Coleophoma cylindrospora TaxID=1849047 RepID=A0A3D8SDF3_9HELO|nr:NADH:flavin oxidoreductase oxidase family protein-like protein [Coleophoma cylindrospora]